MSEHLRPDTGDQALLEAFVAAVTTQHALNDMPSDTEELDLGFVAALTEHNLHRTIVYTTPPQTMAGAFCKLLLLVDPEFGIEAGRRGARGGPDIECLNQVVAFLAAAPGAVEALTALPVDAGGVRFDAVAAALAEAKRRALGDFRNARVQAAAPALLDN
jgi:hypothetical protein